MKLKLSGTEKIDVSSKFLWNSIIDPKILKECIPGCHEMKEVSDGEYKIVLNLKVGAVGGSFDGKVKLSDQNPPIACKLNLSGGGTLGTGKGYAKIIIDEKAKGTSLMRYEGEGEVAGLVAGVGQRVLLGVAKHLVKKFFSSIKVNLSNNRSQSQ